MKSNCITKYISESPQLRLDADDEGEWVEVTLAFYKAKNYESDAEICAIIKGQPLESIHGAVLASFLSCFKSLTIVAHSYLLHGQVAWDSPF